MYMLCIHIPSHSVLDRRPLAYVLYLFYIFFYIFFLHKPSHSALDRRPPAHVLIAPSTCPLLPILKRQGPSSIFTI